MKSLVDCKDAVTRNTGEVMKDDGFGRVLIRGGIEEKDGCVAIYAKDLTTVL